MTVSRTILIVDDYNTMIRSIRNLLRRLGFRNSDQVKAGEVALAKPRAWDYARVISDSDMLARVPFTTQTLKLKPVLGAF